MTIFVLNVAASIVGGIVLAIFLPQLQVLRMWNRYWPEVIGIVFVFLWLGGYAAWRIVHDYRKFRAWLEYAPDTDADAKNDKNLYMRINRLISAKLNRPHG